MTDNITSFSGEYRFLSNFYPSPITVPRGYALPSEPESPERYRTVEHAFQAFKSDNPEVRAYIAEQPTPGAAKRAGARVVLRDGWDELRLSVMERLLQLKFAPGSPIADKLLATGNAHLVEGNTWGDTFWGVDTRTDKGYNHLGGLLMRRRFTLRESRETLS